MGKVTALGRRMFHCSVAGETFNALRESDLKKPTRICAGFASVKWMGADCCMETRMPVRPSSSGATVVMGVGASV